MNITFYDGLALLCVLGMIWGIRWMNSPKTAVRGNLLGAVSLLGAVVITLLKNGIVGYSLLWTGMAIGGIIGYFLAIKVTMLKMPQMIALLNGLGGGASGLVAVVVLTGDQWMTDFLSRGTAVLALAVGGITLSGSLIAAAKLDQRISQRPVRLEGHDGWMILGLAAYAACMLLMFLSGTATYALWLTAGFMLLISFAVGILFTIRVGGADMPITISLLNSLSGMAGAIAGFAIYDPLLVAVGGIVGAAGLILTQIMCKSMNRSLAQVLTGHAAAASAVNKEKAAVTKENTGTATKAAVTTAEVKAETAGDPANGPAADPAAAIAGSTRALSAKDADHVHEDDDARVKRMVEEAVNVIIVPGYGMALAQAQYQIKELYEKLTAKGKNVKFAIHPVAGRMPGHMNVLLAEVDIPYELLYEMDAINEEFRSTDLVIVVGANDVINPAANTAEGTPIYGMPVLKVDEAKHVIICNRDTNPGYSGVPNTIYQMDKVILKLGDAKETLRGIGG